MRRHLSPATAALALLLACACACVSASGCADEAAGNPTTERVTVEDMEGYVRQYTGVEGGGTRHLIVAGICEGAAEDMEWQDGWIEVADGGTCFWDATMDLDSGEILRLSLHGAA